MGGDSERDLSKDIDDVKVKSGKVISEVRENFAKMQKLKAEALMKLEEMMGSVEKDLEKLQQKIVKSENLVSESKTRLNSEIEKTLAQIKEKYSELKKRIVASIVP